jgi:hypothetical protein
MACSWPVARAHTKKPFSTKALFQTLRFVWGLANDSDLREVDENMYTFKIYLSGRLEQGHEPRTMVVSKVCSSDH